MDKKRIELCPTKICKRPNKVVYDVGQLGVLAAFENRQPITKAE